MEWLADFLSNFSFTEGEMSPLGVLKSKIEWFRLFNLDFGVVKIWVFSIGNFG